MAVVDDMLVAVRGLAALGPRNVLVKGGRPKLPTGELKDIRIHCGREWTGADYRPDVGLPNSNAQIVVAMYTSRERILGYGV